MNTLDAATQPIDLTGWSVKPGATVTTNAPLPGPPQRVSPIAPGISTIANSRIATSQNQADYAVKRLFTKPQALAPSATLSSGASTTISNGGLTVVTNTLTVTDGINVYGPLFPLVKPPSAASFTVLNGGSTGFSDAFGGIFIQHPNLTTQLIGLMNTRVSGSPFTLTIAQILDYQPANQAFSGILVRRSTNPSSSEYFLFHDGTTSAGAYSLSGSMYTNAFAFNVNQFTTTSVPASGLRFLRVTYDGTNISCSASNNGFDFSNIVASFLAVTPVDGIGIAIAAGGSQMTSLILSYQVI